MADMMGQVSGVAEWLGQPMAQALCLTDPSLCSVHVVQCHLTASQKETGLQEESTLKISTKTKQREEVLSTSG